MKTTTKQSGFTLVELAIVLVIIGLIVGGVLAGSDLIKAATLQKAVKQVGDINTGANTFRTKYNDLPGDLKNPQLVFATVTGSVSTTPGLGDGNGFIDATAIPATPTITTTLGVSGEVGVFFYELAQAGYIKEAITATGGTGNVAMAGSVGMTQAQFKTSFQPTALGKDSYFVVSSGTATTTANDGRNYIVVAGAITAAGAAAGVATFTPGMAPVEAASFDTKLDDGVATTGAVISVALGTPVPQTLGGGTTNTDDGTNCYDAATKAYFSSFTQKSCSLSIRASF